MEDNECTRELAQSIFKKMEKAFGIVMEIGEPVTGQSRMQIGIFKDMHESLKKIKKKDRGMTKDQEIILKEMVKIINRASIY